MAKNSRLTALLLVALLAGPAWAHDPQKEKEERERSAQVERERERERARERERLAQRERDRERERERLAERRARQQSFEQLRNTNDFQPMRLEDAQPESGLQGQLSFLNVDETGDDGLLLRPQMEVGLGKFLEFGAALPTGQLEGRTEVGPFEAHVLGQILPESGVSPAVALKGAVIAPSDDAGLSGQLDALATKTFGMQRVHLNAGYRPQADAGDRYTLGVAADQAIGEKVLLLGETFLERQEDQGDTVFGADLGSVWQMGRHVQLMGSVGLRRFGPDVDPWVLVGVSGSS